MTEDICMLARDGSWTQVRTLVEDGEDINARDLRGETVITIACSEGNAAEAEWLLDRGADPNANTIRFSALARFRQQLELFMIFRISCNCPTARLVKSVWNAIRYGGPNQLTMACPSVSQGGGRSPLVAAASRGHNNCIKTLLDNRARLDALCATGDTPLIAATRTGCADTVRLLLSCGANPDLRNLSGSTPLLWAARNGNSEIASVLLEHGAKVDVRDLEACTPLLAACAAGHEGVANSLLAKGASIDARTAARWTALMAAVSTGATGLVKSLLAKGADVHAVGKDGITAVTIAEEIGRPDLIELLSATNVPVFTRP